MTNPDLLAALLIGYADGTLLERAPEGSETWTALQGLGLLSASGREHLSGCLVVPLRDLAGAVVSLYGRKIDGDGHLYLPGPRRGLVNAASAATCDELILAESVLDALSFLQAGIPSAVPIYGTNGWTSDHDALLEAHRIQRVVLALDADDAGRKAAQILGEKLRAKGIDVLDILLPVKDPNQLLVAEGPEGFRETWRRLVSAEAKRPGAGPGTDAVALAGAPVLMPAQEDPAGAAAKEENDDAPTLTCDEPGAYHLQRGLRNWRVRGLLAHGVDRLRVNLRVEDNGRFHVDTFDLYSARSRSGFADAAVKALRLPEGEEGALLDEIAGLIDALEKERLSLRGRAEPKSEGLSMTESDQAAAMAFLTAPNLVEKLKTDFVAAGCIGEETALLIGYLALVSRKLPEPLSVLFCARSGAGKSTLQDRLADFCPPEDLVKYTRISGQVLFYKDETALRHKLLAVDEEDGASSAAYALRSLLSSGYLSCSVTRTDPQTGRQVADDRRVEGPTTVFLTSAHPEALDYETRNRFVLLTVDESAEQTRKILALQRWNETLEGLLARERRKAFFKRHHDAQRLLLPLDVVIPFDVVFPSSWLILRREQKKYLTLIKALTLLHQHQRPKKTVAVDGRSVTYIEASKADAELARELVAVILRRSLDELAPPSRSLLLAMQGLVREKKKALVQTKTEAEADREGHAEKGERRYVLNRGDERDERLLLDRHEIQRSTGLSLWHVKTYLAQLVEYEYVALVSGRKGKRCRYELVEGGDDEDLGSVLARAM